MFTEQLSPSYQFSFFYFSWIIRQVTYIGDMLVQTSTVSELYLILSEVLLSDMFTLISIIFKPQYDFFANSY